MRPASSLLALLLAACSTALPDTPAACDAQHVVGETAQAIRAEAITVDEGGVRAVHDGDTLTLRQPPQGGYILFAGARATNLHPCGVQISAELLDTDGGTLTNRDTRSSDLVDDQGGLYAPPQALLATDVPNVPACPDNLHVGVDGKDAVLHVRVLDTTSKSADLRVPVKVSCLAGDTHCACVCGPNPHGC